MSAYVRGTLVAVLAALLFFGSGMFSASAQEGSEAGDDGFRALNGEQARGYEVPDDLREVWSSTDPEGITQTRYQQYVGEAAVQGGQTTVLSESGEQIAVTGSYYPDIEPANDVELSKGQARAAVKRQRGQSGRFPTQLLIDPQTGRQFYEVDSQRFGSRVVFHIDAESGRRIDRYDNLQDASEPGIGVKGDTKLLDTSETRRRGGVSTLVSEDGRQETEDARNKKTLKAGKLFTDEDGAWTDQGRTSPGQAAGVDAHYYANLTDDYYRDIHGRNSLDDEGMTMLSSAHYTEDYNNAFWNGQQMVYGDGNGEVFRELSGGLDVVSHELTHGVTDYTSDLIYLNESGG